MTVGNACPSCGGAIVADENLSECGRCHASRASADPDVGGSTLDTPQPLLIGYGSALGLVGACVGPAFVIWGLLSATPIWVNGHDLHDRASFQHLDVCLVLALMPLAGLVSWGLWRRRAWVRHVMFVGALAVAFLQATGGAPDATGRRRLLLLALPDVLLPGWYLYYKPNVVAYFRKLREA